LIWIKSDLNRLRAENVKFVWNIKVGNKWEEITFKIRTLGSI
jgi:hypothetical protein